MIYTTTTAGAYFLATGAADFHLYFLLAGEPGLEPGVFRSRAERVSYYTIPQSILAPALDALRFQGLLLQLYDERNRRTLVFFLGLVQGGAEGPE